jgi:hypothetical protein
MGLFRTLRRVYRPPRQAQVRAVFLRGLGLTYWAAFRSLRRQLPGLFGQRGIVPLAARLEERKRLGRSRFWRIPTLFWFGASDRALLRACRAGEVLGAVLALGLAPRLCCALLWPLYLSFVAIGSPFLNFQWDSLLLETGFLATLTAPGGLWVDRGRGPSWAGTIAFRWLAFRLHFESGLCKVQSQDPSWRGLTACRHHYETQPLPAPTAWYLRQLPERFHRATTLGVLGLELVVPPLVLLTRPFRRIAFWKLQFLQLAIAATGNFGFFNLLSSLITLWVSDDDALPRRWRPRDTPWPSAGQTVIESLAITPLLLASGDQLLSRFSHRRMMRDGRLGRALSRAYAVSPYGLFAVMTTTRPEIELEGSEDGRTWRSYHFRFKPGPLNGRPRFVGLSMPRLDWQMWFAALGPRPEWFDALVVRLLEASPGVLALLAEDPFEGRRPRYVRARLYEYEMTSAEERRESGNWWKREPLGLYLRPSALASAEATAGAW